MRSCCVLILLAGCASDPCAGLTTCIDLTVQGSGNVTQVDQLELGVGGRGAKRTPVPPGPATLLPIRTAIDLTDWTGGKVDLWAYGFLGGDKVGRGFASATAKAGTRTPMTVTLAALTPPPVDGSADLTVLDLSQPDLSPEIRYVFLGAKHTGKFASGSDPQAAANQLCSEQASPAGLPGTYVALLGRSSKNPRELISIDDRPIVLPDGVTQVSAGADFWTTSHQHPIDQLADQSQVFADSCVWTAFMADGTTAGGHDCDGWLSDQSIGGSTTVGAAWGGYTPALACSLPCYFYCLEQ